MLSHPARYRIRVQGRLGPAWTVCFGGLTLSWQEPDQTALRGQIVDKATLHGILNAIREPSPAPAGSPTPGARSARRIKKSCNATPVLSSSTETTRAFTCVSAHKQAERHRTTLHS